MSKFLSRRVAGIPVWLWIVGCVACAIAIKEFWVLVFGSGAGVLALRQAAIEAGDKADRLLRAAEEQLDTQANEDSTVQDIGEKAKLDAIENIADWQDSDSEFME